jgi:fructokinase
MDYLLGLDLGGTKIEGVIIHKHTHEVLDRKRIATESQKGYDQVLTNICELISSLCNAHQLQFIKVGIGTPGTLDPLTNTMKNCNAEVLNGKLLKEDLEKLLGMNVNLSNDANCFAIAEYQLGVVPKKMKNAQVVFGVIMGTGVGGGLVVEGKVIGGRQGIGGEWGHNFLDESGGLCYCGKVGCVERIISGPSLERYYESLSGKKKSLADIIQLYRSKSDDVAIETVQRLLHFYGKAISVVINIIDPDIIIIGGGVGNIDEIYTLGFEEIKKHVFNSRLDTIIVKPLLGDSAGVFGAAFL